jgi:mRNA interferase MazF
MPRDNSPFEVPLPPGSPIEGAVLADQVKTLDWRARRADFAARLTDEATAEVIGKLSALLEG